MSLKFNENIFYLKDYIAGKSIKEAERELGIKKFVQLASNENPLGVSEAALKAMKDVLEKANRYPSSEDVRLLMEKIALKYKFSSNNIVLGAGSDELIKMLAYTFLDKKEDEVIMAESSFPVYDIVTKTMGAKSIFVPLDFHFKIDLAAVKEKITSNTRLIFLTNPNNPTGSIILEKDFKEFIKDIPDNIVVVIDEAYIEFARDENILKSLKYVKKNLPVVVLRTFSKAYGLAGLRIGYGIMAEHIAFMLRKTFLPFNINALALAAANAAIEDEDFLNKTVRHVHKEIDIICLFINKIELSYVPTQANFLFIFAREDSDSVYLSMLKKGVIIRSMKSYGEDRHIRMSIGSHEENIKFMNTFKEVLGL